MFSHHSVFSPPHVPEITRRMDETVLAFSTTSDAIGLADRGFLLTIQRRALSYFLENQVPSGLILDRQRNHGPRRERGLCSTAATGMGLIALALATSPPYRLLSLSDAGQRVRLTLRTALERLPHNHGVVPHFIDSLTGDVYGVDARSTIETAWLVAGGLWAAHFLQDAGLKVLAEQLAERVDWYWWTAPDQPGGRGRIRHGMSERGSFLPCSWDRLNGETVFMYVLAAGATGRKTISLNGWHALQTFHGEKGGHCFNNADLGLFVFQYGLDLLDLRTTLASHQVDLAAEAALATRANLTACREWADRFRTYHHYWGLSAGDGPPSRSSETEGYRCYSPAGPVDGTAHLMATLASVAHEPGAVLEQLRRARFEEREVVGRYGYSNLNLDHDWTARDMVGIDAGAAVLALDNFLMANRVRAVFHRLPIVQRGLDRLGIMNTAPRTGDAILSDAC